MMGVLVMMISYCVTHRSDCNLVLKLLGRRLELLCIF